jgi:hypothetical protein
MKSGVSDVKTQTPTTSRRTKDESRQSGAKKRGLYNIGEGRGKNVLAVRDWQAIG